MALRTARVFHALPVWAGPRVGSETGSQHTLLTEDCTAPDFLDTERDVVMILYALASGEKTSFWGDTQIAPPVVKAPL